MMKNIHAGTLVPLRVLATVITRQPETERAIVVSGSFVRAVLRLHERLCRVARKVMGVMRASILSSFASVRSTCFQPTVGMPKGR